MNSLVCLIDKQATFRQGFKEGKCRWFAGACEEANGFFRIGKPVICQKGQCFFKTLRFCRVGNRQRRQQAESKEPEEAERRGH